jgi:hypothetical protein
MKFTASTKGARLLLLALAAPCPSASWAIDPSIVVASRAGARLDSDLRSGGGTDDTRILQRILDRARSGRSVHLIVDGPALITGLDIHSDTTIECLSGAGFYLKDNSDRAMIRNAHRSRDRIDDRHIRIVGCYFNGNRQGQNRVAGPFVSQSDVNIRISTPRQEADGTFKSMLQFFGVENISLERLTLFNGRAFGSWIANARRITIRDIEVDSNFPEFSERPTVEEVREFNRTHRTNGDGLHFGGPIQYLDIDSVRLRTDDDGIGLNANNMGVDDVTRLNDSGPYVGQGPITDVTVRNVMLMGSLVGLRMLSTNQRIDRILIENVTGTVRGRAVVLSPWTNRLRTPHKGNFGTVAFSNISLAALPFYDWRMLYPDAYTSGSGGNWDFGEEGDSPFFSINAPVEDLSITNALVRAIDDRPVIRFGRSADVGMARVDLQLNDTSGRAVPVRVYQGHVRRLRLTIDWRSGAALPRRSPIEFEDGRVDELVLDPPDAAIPVGRSAPPATSDF